MIVNQRKIQQRFEGFLQTPNLWNGNTVFGLEQFCLDEQSTKITIGIDENQRLGKYVEALVFYQLQQQKNVELLAQNVQIQREKLTLGELDGLVKIGDELIHLEIIYKFYLYDNSVGTSEIEHLIGPNRKDSLVEKLNKLKQKQLPLLYSTECKNFISTLDLDVANIKQQVCFKAQLYVPYNQIEIEFELLNTKAIDGYYINQNEMRLFTNCKFFIPTKKDWLIKPHQFVSWIVFDDFKVIAKNYFQEKYSPLCWIKKPNGLIDKAFLVWW